MLALQILLALKAGQLAQPFVTGVSVTPSFPQVIPGLFDKPQT